MNARRYLALFLCLGACFVLSGCMLTQNPDASSGAVENAATAVPVAKATVTDINSITLQDDPQLYSRYDPLSVVHFYVTVRHGTPADGTNHTFAEVNSYVNLQSMTNVQKICANAIVQIGNEIGPIPGEIGFGATEPNATINVRGRTSTTAAQKSYRLSFFDNAGLWRGQRDIALSKHPNDPTRLRNALYFRFLQD
ncbi:MAG: CotH kinase family protein, partial [Clostridia bacterium]